MTTYYAVMKKDADRATALFSDPAEATRYARYRNLWEPLTPAQAKAFSLDNDELPDTWTVYPWSLEDDRAFECE